MGKRSKKAGEDPVIVRTKAQGRFELDPVCAIRAREIMSHPVAAVRMDALVREAARIMIAQGVSGLVVLDGAGQAVGIISASDIVRYEITRQSMVLSQEEHQRLEAEARERMGTGFHMEHMDLERVRDVMTPTLVTAPASATLAHLSELMEDRRIHRIFVEEKGKIIGIVTASDIARVLSGASRPMGSPWES